jgi:hypothetical protein
MKNKLLLLVSVIFSIYIGFSDLHQTDTPITLGMLLAASFLVGLFAKNKPWIYGIIIGIGVPVAGFIAASRHMLLSGMEHGTTKYWPATYGSAAMSSIAILVAILGVYVGVWTRKAVRPITD